MKIDLHIHSKNGSDGRWTLQEIFAEADKRHIDVISIADHDSIESQAEAHSLADRYGIRYLFGVELNVTFAHPGFKNGKNVSLDCLGYDYKSDYPPLVDKLLALRTFRQKRAEQILENLNHEFHKEGRREFTAHDLEAIQATVDGAFGRPHIAGYLMTQGIVSSKQEAFNKYLVKCDVPKMPLSLEEAALLLHGAQGKLILAHPNDPNGTSLVSLTHSRAEQQQIIREAMFPHIDGVECWHSRHDADTIESYAAFAQKEGIIATGGSDCHQQPVRMGTLHIPDFVAEQFDFKS
jgi:predicted metal-dependent phosphoesterase TrpH